LDAPLITKPYRKSDLQRVLNATFSLAAVDEKSVHRDGTKHGVVCDLTVPRG